MLDTLTEDKQAYFYLRLRFLAMNFVKELDQTEYIDVGDESESIFAAYRLLETLLELDEYGVFGEFK